jgi:hypothetical protein
VPRVNSSIRPFKALNVQESNGFNAEQLAALAGDSGANHEIPRDNFLLTPLIPHNACVAGFEAYSA